MLTQEKNKIKGEITLVFELQLTVALHDSSRTFLKKKQNKTGLGIGKTEW